MNIHQKHLRTDGAKQSTISKGGVFTDTRPKDLQGNPLPKVVAMVAACVAHYRKFHKPLKTIYLCPAYYVRFTDWCRWKATEMQADLKVKLFTFDGVEIDQMEAHHVIKAKDGDDTFDYDFYDPNKTLNDIN